MKRKSNYNAGKGKGGSYTDNIPDKKPNPRLRPVQKPKQSGDGWVSSLVNDPLELLCFALLCLIVFWIITLFR